MDEKFKIDACVLPTNEKPFRAAEFEALVATAVRSVDLLGPTEVRLHLAPEPSTAAQVAHLMVRETACCSFFSFVLTARSEELTLHVSVPEHHRGVLEAIIRQIPLGAQP